MINSALVLGVTGIVVSGVVGPGIAAWMANKSQLGEFRRSEASADRDQLRALIDEAAVLLASGASNLRILEEADPDPVELQSALEWKLQVFPIGQRLQLWLAHDDPVVVAYERVRLQMVAAGEAAPGTDTERQLDEFEKRRREFLDVSRARLLEPIPAYGKG